MIKKTKTETIARRDGSRLALVECASGTFGVVMPRRTGAQELTSFFSPTLGSAWEAQPVGTGDMRMVPWGPDNLMPQMVRDLLERNNIGPGILQRKTGLIYGEGPMLQHTYIDAETGEVAEQWADDMEVQQWLDSWPWRSYVRDALQETVHLNGHFTRYVMGRGSEATRPWVARLDCLSSTDCRLFWPGKAERRPWLQDVERIVVGDIERMRNLEVYPRFSESNLRGTAARVDYHRLRSFGRSLYALPSFHGSIPWMQDSNDIPEIVRALNDNVIAAAYIVHEPEAYWREKRMALEADHPDWTDARVNRELDRLRDKVTAQIADVMAGKRNAGKFFSCIDFTDDRGNQQTWKVEPIELNLDKYITAQKDIARMADSATTSAMGLSPALSNIIIDGKSDSGSQMLYALKIFYASDTRQPEEVVLEALNRAIRLNFPQKKGLRMAFRHKIVEKEDNVTASDRAVNQI